LPVADTTGAFAVDYRAGLLSVVAEKAELGKVLDMVGSKTGASIEVAPEIAAEPVVAHLGPAAPRQILSELLDSPHLAYIVMGSDEDGSLQRIVIRKRNSFGRQLAAARAPAPAPEPVPEAQPVQEQAPPAAAEQAQTAATEPAAPPQE
jgi:type II secretory pathway component GspD/PulD (secretin)